MTVYFDMDGTIADLYGAKDWLPRLRAYDAKIYAEARPLCNMNTLARKRGNQSFAPYRSAIVPSISK